MMTTPPALMLSPAAQRRLTALLPAQQAFALRVEVQGGGCSGFQYAFHFIQEADIQPDDTLMAEDTARVVVDATSAALLQGSTLDYVETLGSSAFEITNPQAKSSCGCGNSFSL